MLQCIHVNGSVHCWHDGTVKNAFLTTKNTVIHTNNIVNIIIDTDITILNQ